MVSARPSSADSARTVPLIPGEPSGIGGPEFEFLHLLSRGLSCFKVRVWGTQTHRSLTDRLPSVNANVKMAEVLTRLRRDLRLTFRPHPLCAAPTINLGVKVEGGVGYGVCPGVAEFQTDIRTLPGMTRAQLQGDVERYLKEMRRDDPGLRVELEFEIAQHDPVSGEPDMALFETLADALRELDADAKPIPMLLPGVTDGRFFSRLGIQTYGFLPMQLPPELRFQSLLHAADERVPVAALDFGTAILETLLSVYRGSLP